MTAQCRQCGRFIKGKSHDPIKEAKTAELRRDVAYLKKIDAAIAEMTPEEILDEALNVPGFDRHMGSV